jgi:transcriptional regulator with XRE-family HTH domain
LWHSECHKGKWSGVVGNPLARFIKSHRSQRGLTQKQLAEAAHVSASYVTKIEQGRAPQPGDSVLNRMAEALALDSSDTHTLYMLADRTPPRALNSAPITATGTNPLINLFRRDHDDVLWSIVDAHLNVIDSNSLYQSSFPGIGDHSSFAEWLFRDSRARLVHEEWEVRANSTVWWLRRAATRSGDRGAFDELLGRLEESFDFRRLWNDPLSARGPEQTMKIRDYRTRKVITLDSGYYSRFPDDQTYVWVGVPAGS